VTVTSARTKNNVPRIGARLPLRVSLALGAQNGKLDADLRTFALIGTPFVHSIHDYNPFAMEDGGRLTKLKLKLFTTRTVCAGLEQLPYAPVDVFGPSQLCLIGNLQVRVRPLTT
jgi:hypothetical protein